MLMCLRDPFLSKAVAAGVAAKWGLGNQWTWNSGFTFGFLWISGFSEILRISKVKYECKGLTVIYESGRTESIGDCKAEAESKTKNQRVDGNNLLPAITLGLSL